MTAMRGKLRFLPFCKLASILRRSKARANSDSKLKQYTMKNNVLYSFNKYTSDDYKACLSEIGDDYEWEIAEDQTTDAWALSLPEITQEIVDSYHLVDFRCVNSNDYCNVMIADMDGNGLECVAC